MPVTAAQLATQARELSDTENDLHISTSELDRRVDYGYRELWNLVRRVCGDDFFLAQTATITTLTATNTTYTLPTDFGAMSQVRKILGTGGDDYEEIGRFLFRESPASRLSYRVAGGIMYMSPAVLCTGSFVVWYQKKYTELAGAGNMDAGLEEWREYPAIVAAMGCLAKQESAYDYLAMRRNEMREEIQSTFARRDMMPDRIIDVMGNGSEFPRLPRA